MKTYRILSMKRLLELVEDIPDKRRTSYGNYHHSLVNVLAIALMAIISGFSTWEDMESYAKGKKGFLAKLLHTKKDSMPSKSTFRRVLSLIKTTKLEEIYREAIVPNISADGSNHYSVDGKTCRGAGKYDGCGIHTVSVYATESGISIGQQVVGAKSNEINAIPLLLNDLDISGSTISIDAIGCQEKIAELIQSNGGDYILALKGNQKNTYESVVEYFPWAENDIAEKRILDTANMQEAGHGRVVRWRIVVTHEVNDFEFAPKWKGLKSIVMVERTCKYKGKTTRGRRYFLSSLSLNAEGFIKEIRNHWGIENSLHWVLDVEFGEDASRIHEENAAQNMSILRKMAHAFMHNHKTTRASYHGMQVRALLDDDYMISLFS